MNTTNTTTTTNSIIGDLVYQSFCSMAEIVIEALIGFIIVRFKLIKLENCKLLTQMLSYLQVRILIPAKLIINFSKTINIKVFTKSWILIVLGVLYIGYAFVIGNFFGIFPVL